MRKWLRRLGIGVATIVIAALVAGSGFEWLGRRTAARDFPPPGTLVDIGGRRIHLDCRGSGTPVVVLVSGLDTGGAMAWSAVHDSLAATTRTCAYSRAGIMWSDAATGPTTAKGVADDLHAALGAAGERAPYVMVGHSLGGPYIMTYTKYFGPEVSGVVMVDASHPDQLETLGRIAPAAANPSMTPLKVAAAFSWAGVVRIATGATPAMPNQSPEVVRAIAAYASHSIDGALKELDALGGTLAEAGTMRQLGDRPLVVLTALKPMTEAELATLKITPDLGRAFKAAWRAMHDDEATWSTRSEHRVLEDASHYIQYDRPDVVIQSVRSVVDSVRQDRP